jgi:hypothetical protein
LVGYIIDTLESSFRKQQLREAFYPVPAVNSR